MERHTLLENLFEIPPKTIVPGNTPTMRCCLQRKAILSGRVKMAIGGNPNIIGVIDIACDRSVPWSGCKSPTPAADASPPL